MRLRPGILLVALVAVLASYPPGPLRAEGGTPAPVTRLEDLIGRFRAMPGFSARFEEEKTIALLSRPLRSRGAVYFAPPALLVRRVEEPVPSLLELDADQLRYSDATGSEQFDLGANPTARVFARTFTDVLAGDLPRLEATYQIAFRAEKPGPAAPESAWQIELTPRDAALARGIESLRLRGHGVALVDLVVREGSGDVTATRFSDVDAKRHFEESEIARLLRPPAP